MTATLLTGLLAAPREAAGYCRRNTCKVGNGGEDCEPSTGCSALFWQKPCLSVSLQKDASSQVPLETVRKLTQQAFQTWLDAECATGGKPAFSVTLLPDATCDEKRYNVDGANANVLMFRDQNWPYEPSTLEFVTLSYRPATGEILDADVEINSTVALTVGDTGVKYDLLSLLTHAAGHFFGLAHSAVPGATMSTSLSPGSLELRSLEEDDRAAICALFPPTSPLPAGCDPTPSGGFSPQCVGAPQGISGTPVTTLTGAAGAPPSGAAGGSSVGLAGVNPEDAAGCDCALPAPRRDRSLWPGVGLLAAALSAWRRLARSRRA